MTRDGELLHRGGRPAWIARWRQKVADLEREVYALYFAARDPRVPWYTKALAACIVAYALSPIDLIPDPIPVLGYLDDLLLIPLGILAVRALVPAAVLADCREQASRAAASPRRWIGACAVVAIWLLVAGAGFSWWMSR